jgi:hypothetical protein
MNKHSFIGGKSKGKTLSDVAQMHGMTTDELRPQYKKGTEHELEHTTSVVIARRIALDHLVEFPDYYDRLDKIEKMKKGAVVEKTMTFNDMVLYYERKGNWLFAKGNFYAWLYDQDGAGKKVETGEYDFIMFPPMGKGSPFSEKYVPPLLMVWQKSYQKNYKGSEHLLGIVKGFYDEDKNQLIIDMMTSNPKFRRKGINAHIIKQLRTEFGVSQDNVIFDKPTKEGKLFESSKKYHLGGDMSKHLAPNGKPSNLTHEQWHLVRTPEFKAWFGDWENDPKNASKVVDENGEPLVVYHGTNNQFNVFKPTEYTRNFGTIKSNAFFFAKDKIVAEYITELKSDKDSKKIILPVFLNITNILDFTDVHIVENVLPSLIGDLPEGDLSENMGYLFYIIEDKEISDEIKKMNYDGVQLIEGYLMEQIEDLEGDIIQSYAVFEPNQIKLADGTNTTFDGGNPDIRFDKGGRTIAQTPAPKSDRVSGSKTNPKGSASDSYLGKSIKFNDALTKAIQNKVDEYNEKHPSDKVSLATAKAVVRRGFGAYSKSHRPTITGGAPNSRQAWGLARLNKFLIKKSGGKVKSAYIQDDDLL